MVVMPVNHQMWMILIIYMDSLFNEEGPETTSHNFWHYCFNVFCLRNGNLLLRTSNFSQMIHKCTYQGQITFEMQATPRHIRIPAKYRHLSPTMPIKRDPSNARQTLVLTLLASTHLFTWWGCDIKRPNDYYEAEMIILTFIWLSIISKFIRQANITESMITNMINATCLLTGLYKPDSLYKPELLLPSNL